MNQKVWFHGTRTRKNAKSIIRDGFRIGTYFARHMEDAVAFGGKYVFFVRVQFSPRQRNAWQVTCANVIPPSSIKRLVLMDRYLLKKMGGNFNGEAS